MSGNASPSDNVCGFRLRNLIVGRQTSGDSIYRAHCRLASYILLRELQRHLYVGQMGGTHQSLWACGRRAPITALLYHVPRLHSSARAVARRKRGHGDLRLYILLARSSGTGG